MRSRAVACGRVLGSRQVPGPWPRNLSRRARMWLYMCGGIEFLSMRVQWYVRNEITLDVVLVGC